MKNIASLRAWLRIWGGAVSRVRDASIASLRADTGKFGRRDMQGVGRKILSFHVDAEEFGEVRSAGSGTQALRLYARIPGNLGGGVCRVWDAKYHVSKTVKKAFILVFKNERFLPFQL